MGSVKRAATAASGATPSVEESANEESVLNALPHELLMLVLRALPPASLARVAQTCARLHRAAIRASGGTLARIAALGLEGGAHATARHRLAQMPGVLGVDAAHFRTALRRPPRTRDLQWYTTTEALGLVVAGSGWPGLNALIDCAANKRRAVVRRAQRRCEATAARVHELDAWLCAEQPLGPDVTSMAAWRAVTVAHGDEQGDGSLGAPAAAVVVWPSALDDEAPAAMPMRGQGPRPLGALCARGGQRAAGGPWAARATRTPSLTTYLDHGLLETSASLATAKQSLMEWDNQRMFFQVEALFDGSEGAAHSPALLYLLERHIRTRANGAPEAATLVRKGHGGYRRYDTLAEQRDRCVVCVRAGAEHVPSNDDTPRATPSEVDALLATHGLVVDHGAAGLKAPTLAELRALHAQAVAATKANRPTVAPLRPDAAPLPCVKAMPTTLFVGGGSFVFYEDAELDARIRAQQERVACLTRACFPAGGGYIEPAPGQLELAFCG